MRKESVVVMVMMVIGGLAGSALRGAVLAHAEVEPVSHADAERIVRALDAQTQQTRELVRAVQEAGRCR